MKKMGLCLALALLVSLLLPVGQLRAAPMPPKIVVNHELKQCGEIFGGDECMDCFPMEGWEVLGFYPEVKCPEGYTMLEEVNYTCEGFRNQRCCSEGHSGAAGNCEDLAINHASRECVFVTDLAACDLPGKWERRSATADRYGWDCPSNYSWLLDSTCAGLGQADSGGGILTILLALTCGLAVLLGLAVLVGLILWARSSRRREQKS